jgi:hypothetical protein
MWKPDFSICPDPTRRYLYCFNENWDTFGLHKFFNVGGHGPQNENGVTLITFIGLCPIFE